MRVLAGSTLRRLLHRALHAQQGNFRRRLLQVIVPRALRANTRIQTQIHASVTL